MATVKARTDRRKATVRRAIKEAATGRARLSVFRSSKHIYAQVIDDAKGETVAAASSIEKDVRGQAKTGANIAAAKSFAPCSRTRRRLTCLASARERSRFRRG